MYTTIALRRFRQPEEKSPSCWCTACDCLFYLLRDIVQTTYWTGTPCFLVDSLSLSASHHQHSISRCGLSQSSMNFKETITVSTKFPFWSLLSTSRWWQLNTRFECCIVTTYCIGRWTTRHENIRLREPSTNWCSFDLAVYLDWGDVFISQQSVCAQLSILTNWSWRPRTNPLVASITKASGTRFTFNSSDSRANLLGHNDRRLGPGFTNGQLLVKPLALHQGCRRQRLRNSSICGWSLTRYKAKSNVTIDEQYESQH